MNCETFQAQLPLVISEPGRDGERAALAEHATGCLSCRRTLQDWEEAQRALETALASTKLDPARLQSLSDSLYVERFGSALEMRSPAPAAPAARTPIPAATALSLSASPLALLIAVGAGLVLGYAIWGSAGSSGQMDSMTQQIWLQYMMAAQGMGRFPATGGGFMPPGARLGMIGSVANLTRDLLSICFIIWVTRSRVWEVVFPKAVPRGVYMARWLAIPVVMLGGVRLLIGGWFAVGGFFGGTGGGGVIGSSVRWLGQADEEIFLRLFAMLDALWHCGFWLLLFILLFSTVDHLALRFLGAKDPRNVR